MGRFASFVIFKTHSKSVNCYGNIKQATFVYSEKRSYCQQLFFFVFTSLLKFSSIEKTVSYVVRFQVLRRRTQTACHPTHTALTSISEYRKTFCLPLYQTEHIIEYLGQAGPTMLGQTEQRSFLLSLHDQPPEAPSLSIPPVIKTNSSNNCFHVS